MAKLICGCGYLGLRVARKWVTAGQVVWATTRSAERAAEFSSLGLRPILTDLTQELVLPGEAQDIDTVLFAVGFDRRLGQTLENVYQQALEHVLDALNDRVQRFFYASSTGVYGQSGGEWVDEDSLCQPTRVGGRACLAAEQRIAAHPLGDRRIILRLAGLYGPGRIPKLAVVKQGQPLEAPDSGYLNLIHVEDAAAVITALEQRVIPPVTLIVADGQPVLRGDFYRELAKLLHAPAPRLVPPSDRSPVAERATSDKRVSNRQLRELLGSRLAFPSYREGLAAIVAGDPS